MKILTSTFQTKHNTAPFSQIKMEDYQPAFEENIAQARAEINTIINNTVAPTFEIWVSWLGNASRIIIQIWQYDML